MRLVWADVTRVLRDDGDAQRLEVEYDGGVAGVALAYPRLTGRCAAGERVLLNVTAVELGLGTGGVHFVAARAEGGSEHDAASGGHVMKLRYTPLQVDVVSVEAPESPQHELLRDASDVGGMPVVCCGLHSQFALVAAAVKHADPALRVAYCMTDEAALPAAFSDLMRAASGHGLIDTVVTCGQAFGGDHEAVNLHSGLLAARHVARADVAVVAIGPGVVGTGTAFGHGGIAQGEALNAAAAVGGRPIGVVRASFADARPRHRGVSHHTVCALTRIALVPAVVPVVEGLGEISDAIDSELARSGVWGRHERVPLSGPLAAPAMRGVKVTTMGRSTEDDPAFFQLAYAAGDIASAMTASMR